MNLLYIECQPTGLWPKRKKNLSKAHLWKQIFPQFFFPLNMYPITSSKVSSFYKIDVPWLPTLSHGILYVLAYSWNSTVGKQLFANHWLNFFSTAKACMCFTFCFPTQEVITQLTNKRFLQSASNWRSCAVQFHRFQLPTVLTIKRISRVNVSFHVCFFHVS